MKFEKLLKIISEQNSFKYKTVTGYHGSESKIFSLNPEKEIWFVLDRDSQILDYYSGRGSLIEAELNLGNCLDLSMYNTDEIISEESARQFLVDCELSELEINDIIDHVYYTENYDSAEEYDENDIPLLPLSYSLNYCIKNILLKNKKYDSLIIKEADDEHTICMLNTSLINNVQIVKSDET